MHFTKHAVVVKSKEKKNNNAPVMMAPTMLVAAKVIASKITDARMVPKIPANIMGKLKQKHSLVPIALENTDAKSRIAR